MRRLRPSTLGPSPVDSLRREPHAGQAQPRPPDGPLERHAPLDGDPRLDRVRLVASSSATRSARRRSTTDDQGVGESGRAAKAPGRRLLDQPGAARWCSSRPQGPPHGRGPSTPSPPTSASRLEAAPRAAVTPAAALGTDALRLIDFDIRGDAEDASTSPSRPRRRRRRAVAPRPARRAVRRRIVRQGVRRQARAGLPEGRDPLDPDHADHPDRRLRRAAGRRHPGAARPHVGVRGLRPDRRLSQSSRPARARRS